MKIVLPVHHFPPRYSSGAELYTFRLARWLQAHNHHVEVVCIEAIDQGDDNELLATADSYEGISIWRLSFNLLSSADSQLWRYDNPLLRDWFTSYFERTRPDIVHFQAGYLIGVGPLEAACAAGLPTLLTLHDYWFLCPRTILQRGDGSLCTKIPEDPVGCAWCMCLESRRYRIPDQLTAGRLGRVAQSLKRGKTRNMIADRRSRLLPVLERIDAVIAPSRFLADLFTPFVPHERLHISRYGLDLTPFRGQQRSSFDDVLRFGFIGQIAPHKGVHLLVEAFRRLQAGNRSIELHLYGGLDAHPDYVTRLRRIAGTDRRIYFHGRFDNSHVAAILANLDLIVVPSNWYENSPLAILEAQAAGTPIVTAALGGMAELVRDGIDGLHFRPADAADLANTLQRLIEEPALLPHLRSGIVLPRDIEDEMLQVQDMYHNIRQNTPERHT